MKNQDEEGAPRGCWVPQPPRAWEAPLWMREEGKIGAEEEEEISAAPLALAEAEEGRRRWGGGAWPGGRRTRAGTDETVRLPWK